MPSAQSSPNIALIKYWGNRNNDLRLPAADSLSMVLDAPLVQVTVKPADIFGVKSYDAEGIEKPQPEQSVNRLKKHWELTKKYLELIQKHDALPKNIDIVIRSAIPPAIGIASSAAVFSALAEANAALSLKPLTREEVSILGRLGSGSAARNCFGGFVTLENRKGDGIDSTIARQIAPESHWPLHDIVIVPSREEKKVGSTEGHAHAQSSPLFAARLDAIPQRMKNCIHAIEGKDFELLQKVSEEDALDMHRVMEAQSPSLKYLSNDTHRILKEIESVRKSEHLEVLYTMDAGPTVHLICTEAARTRIAAFAHSQKNCTIFEAKAGPGSKRL